MGTELEVPPLMTRAEFSKIIGVSHAVLKRMIEQGEIGLVGPKIPAREYYKLINPAVTSTAPESGDVS